MRVLVCRCTIGYAGRLTTRLASGDRVVLFKEDGSVAVHALKGAKPINYMAGPTSVREQGEVIRVYRPASDETLTIVVEQVHRDERHALVEVKRVRAIAAAVEQVVRYREQAQRNAALGEIRALVVAPDFAPQAKVLAEARGVECIVLDVPRLLAEAGPDDLTLFS